jgi:UDP:flavonoid glycosyltransferase YjiC (YdhE family)
MTTAAVLCMGGRGHVRPLLPLVRGLVARGVRVVALSRETFRRAFEQAGAEMRDLYAGRSLEEADPASSPLPVRFVTFAGVHAESVASELAGLGTGLVVHDTFTVVAPVAARILGVPCVNVLPNHGLVPSRELERCARDPRVAISPACRAAVETLRGRHGLRDASPFSYVAAKSPFLNLQPEPEEFVPDEARAELSPLECWSSLPLPDDASWDAPSPDLATRSRVAWVAFGTGVFRYFEREAAAALVVVAETLGEAGWSVRIGLGGQEIPAGLVGRLRASGAVVEGDPDQWSELGAAGVFVTHHGLNSSHESIYHGVPMLSCPFFGDQPTLARACQDLGLALPLADAPAAEVRPDRLRRALDRLDGDRPAFAARLGEARAWEIRTARDRPRVLDRVVALAGGCWPSGDPGLLHGA